MFDWKFPADRAGRTEVSMGKIRDSFGRLSVGLGSLSRVMERLGEMAERAKEQSAYALVDAEGGPADVAEEEEEGV
jgi:hypothetical protein